MFLLKWLMGMVTGPIFGDILKGYQSKLAADTSDKKLAGDLAARELLVQQKEIQAQAQLKIAEVGHAWEPEKLAFYITLAYYAKIVVWDVLLAKWTHGSTDALHGQAAAWAEMIMAFYFGKRTFENVSRILTRKWAA